MSDAYQFILVLMKGDQKMSEKQVIAGVMVLAVLCFGIGIGQTATIKGMAKDAFFNGSKIDHIYVCVGSSCYALPGSTSGGKELADTRGSGTGKKAKCVAGSSKCGITWGITGTCQQGANRMLYEIGKTCYRARGYNVTSKLFGTYGSYWDSCRKACYS